MGNGSQGRFCRRAAVGSRRRHRFSEAPRSYICRFGTDQKNVHAGGYSRAGLVTSAALLDKQYVNPKIISGGCHAREFAARAWHHHTIRTINAVPECVERTVISALRQEITHRDRKYAAAGVIRRDVSGIGRDCYRSAECERLPSARGFIRECSCRE